MLAVLFVIKKGYIGRVYVLLHELNHAMWSAVTGNQVKMFYVSRAGGHVETENYSVIAAFAPYFFSIPMALLAAVHLILWIAGSIPVWVRYTEYCIAGFIIGWHIVTTVKVVVQEQSELKQEGLFFSFSAIYAFFFFWNGLFLSVLSPNFYVADFIRLGYKETIFVLIRCGHLAGSTIELIWRLLT